MQVSQHGFSEHDHIQTVVNEKKKLVLHFFTKEMSEEDFSALEKDILSAEEYGIEVSASLFCGTKVCILICVFTFILILFFVNLVFSDYQGKKAKMFQTEK